MRKLRYFVFRLFNNLFSLGRRLIVQSSIGSFLNYNHNHAPEPNTGMSKMSTTSAMCLKTFCKTSKPYFIPT